jgi:hypothetical protein
MFLILQPSIFEAFGGTEVYASFWGHLVSKALIKSIKISLFFIIILEAAHKR